MKLCDAGPAGNVAPRRGVVREKCAQQAAGRQRAGRLRRQTAGHFARRKPPRRDKAERHCGIEVCPAYVTEGVDHGQHHHAECQRYAGVANDTAAGVIDDDGPRAREH